MIALKQGRSFWDKILFLLKKIADAFSKIRIEKSGCKLLSNVFNL